jgi:hypothetical protein
MNQIDHKTIIDADMLEITASKIVTELNNRKLLPPINFKKSMQESVGDIGELINAIANIIKENMEKWSENAKIPDKGWSIKCERELIEEGKIPKIIYIVFGETGEYDDYQQWRICCYDNRNDAIHHAINAQNEGRKILKKYRWFESGEIKNKYDPFFFSRGNIDYGVEPIIMDDGGWMQKWNFIEFSKGNGKIQTVDELLKDIEGFEGKVNASKKEG